MPGVGEWVRGAGWGSAGQTLKALRSLLQAFGMASILIQTAQTAAAHHPGTLAQSAGHGAQLAARPGRR